LIAFTAARTDGTKSLTYHGSPVVRGKTCHYNPVVATKTYHDSPAVRGKTCHYNPETQL